MVSKEAFEFIWKTILKIIASLSIETNYKAIKLTQHLLQQI